MKRRNGEIAYAYYDEFKVDTAATDYQLTVSGFSNPDATSLTGDSFAHHNGMKFSTIDKRNDNLPITITACTELYSGGWWHNTCHVN